MARPLKKIDQKAFEKLCGLQCTLEEICGYFDVTDKTLRSWCRRTYGRGFSEVFSQKRGNGKISLRRCQFRLAEKNANMAIWLGKQYLDQREPDVRGDKPPAGENNLLDAIMATEEVNADDLPEVE